MNAHLVTIPHKGTHFQMVVLSEEEFVTYDENSGEPLPGFLVNSLEQAFAIAELHNAPLLEDGHELLQGDFGL